MKVNMLSYAPLFDYDEQEMEQRSKSFLKQMTTRRTIREFSDKPVPLSVINNCLGVAGHAPSGANKQPWHFVVVSNPELKSQIRAAAEKEEYEFYHQRAPQEWLQDLEPFETNEHKPFLETAPYLIVIFEEKYRIGEGGKKHKNYYTSESVGIATGMLISAIHMSGLACLTHTPSPMTFLRKILKRPENEKPYLILVVGYPAGNAQVPDIQKKSLSAMASFFTKNAG